MVGRPGTKTSQQTPLLLQLHEDIPGSIVGGCVVVYDSTLSLYTRLLHCAGELTQAIFLALNPERG